MLTYVDRFDRNSVPLGLSARMESAYAWLTKSPLAMGTVYVKPYSIILQAFNI
jgi:hypothetical protein